MKKNKITKFLDEKLLLITSCFLLLVIPLYPKLPLFDVVPGYIVRVRTEDFIILFANLILLIQVLRKKVSLRTPVTWLILSYALVGLLATISAIFLTKTIPLNYVHVLKSTLHYLRYLEYFSLFFIFYASVKTKKDFKILVTTAFTSFTLVGLYGLGQKYLYWPVYSTMNREFSKGVRLYLTEHARVQSTFGGHYDMAAYLVITLPAILLATQVTKKKIWRVVFWLIFTLGTWLMIMSASRTSFIALLIAVTTTLIFLATKQKTTKEKLKFLIKKSLTTFSIILIIFISFGNDMNERLTQTLENYPVITATINQTQDWLERTEELFNTKLAISPIQIAKPENSLSTDQAMILVASDTRPISLKPSDVFVDVPDKIKIATISATGEKTTIIIEVPRTYSENALKHGLSLAIRLDTLWPQALASFYRNPLLGTGYATLTKAEVNQFTEADSTDNNYLRTLGETGILGFLTFYGVVFLSLKQAYEVIKNNKLTTEQTLVSITFFSASIGLLVNAIFIDVFASSKVALTFWSLTGVLFAVTQKSTTIKLTDKQKNKVTN